MNWKYWMKKNEFGEKHYFNEDGEFVRLDYQDREYPIIMYTEQENGWIRWNEYDKEGNCVGEGFEGKWK
jgi:hypothetical protein